jgi:hypothetical protein
VTPDPAALTDLLRQLDVADAYAKDENRGPVPSVWQLQNGLLRDCVRKVAEAWNVRAQSEASDEDMAKAAEAGSRSTNRYWRDIASHYRAELARIGLAIVRAGGEMSDASCAPATGTKADLVQRLREHEPEETWTGPNGLFAEAATAIDTLRQELAEARAAIRDAIDYASDAPWDGQWQSRHAAAIARAQEGQST